MLTKSRSRTLSTMLSCQMDMFSEHPVSRVKAALTPVFWYE